jgi:transposase
MLEMGKKNGAPPQTAAAIREAARAIEVKAQTERPVNRRFTTEYKERILRELEELRAGSSPGSMAALLRREGLARNLVARWRLQREAQEEQPTQAKAARVSMADELDQLRRENQRLVIRLAKAEVVIDVQKKLSRLLGIQMPDSDPEEP